MHSTFEQFSQTKISSIETGNGQVDVIGLLIMLIFGILIAGGIGYLYFYISTEFYHHVILSPLFCGVIVALLCTLMIYLATCRNMTIAFLCGILVGIGVCGVYWGAKYLNYLQIKQNNIIEIYQSDGQTPPTSDIISNIINDELIQITGNAGLIGFVRLLSREGLTLELTNRRGWYNYLNDNPAYTRRFTLHIEPEFTYVFWAGELLAIAIIAGIASATTAKRPYSAELKRWIQYQYVGQVSTGKINSFLEAVANQNFITAGMIIDRKNTKDDYPFLDVYVARATPASTNGVLRVVLHIYNDRITKMEKELINSEYENVLPILTSAIKKQPLYRKK
ncbi:MAG: hypothetical protein MUE54_10975 [Anaerolineae bacterium]|nr:hypothetical protein [Anaerolineae bacterium]